VFQTAHGPRWSQSPTGSLERVLPKDACLCAWHNSCVTESAPCARSHTSPFAKVTRSKERAMIFSPIESPTESARRLYLHGCIRSLAI